MMGGTALKIIWFGAFAVIVFIFICYSVFLPLFGDKTQAAWQWLLPNLLPPFGLAVGLAIAEKPKPGATPAPAAKPAGSTPADGAGSGKIALAMSLLYIGALLISVFGVLFKADPIAFLNMTNFWLAPLLGLTTAALGVRMAKPA